jgi:hypothetical protein
MSSGSLMTDISRKIASLQDTPDHAQEVGLDGRTSGYHAICSVDLRIYYVFSAVFTTLSLKLGL